MNLEIRIIEINNEDENGKDDKTRQERKQATKQELEKKWRWGKIWLEKLRRETRHTPEETIWDKGNRN